MAPTADPTTVPGLPETRLHPDQLAGLPTSSPPAPWECRARAIVWMQRATAPEFDWKGTPTSLAVGGFVEYLDTPVGVYHEVLAGAMLRDGFRSRLEVPFMAVDSLASVRGGRVNWGLPKTMATFEGEIGRGTARAVGDGWSMSVRPSRSSARPRNRRLRLPYWSRFRSTGPLGVYLTTMRASSRPMLVHTEAEGETLTGWLGSGRHLAVLYTGRLRVEAPSGPPTG